MRKLELALCQLDDRRLPATFGIPWSSPNLSLSFVPDGTSVSGSDSNLFDSLNQVRSEAEWQREILRAYQTWTAKTNLNITVASDSGDAIGVLGRWQGDERFGDIRIAGTNLGGNVLAIGTPSDPGLAGTRAGDVILNTAYRFDGSPYDLYSVMLHEAGHSLGLNNSPDTKSVMFTHYNGVRTGLSASDITAIQSLYGPRRSDIYEGNYGNTSTARASHLGGIPSGEQDSILLAFGDLTTTNDKDTYSFDTPAIDGGDQTITLKLQTEGISLASAQMQVFYRESNGTEVEVGNVTMNPDSFVGDAVTLSFDANDDTNSRRYFVRVEKADGTPMSVGRYGLAITFSEDGDESLVNEDLLDLQAGTRPVLVNPDGNRDNTRSTAVSLPATSVSATLPNSRFEAIGSLSANTDVDYYRVTVPDGSGPRVLTVNTQSLSGNLSAPMIELQDAGGGLIPTTTLVNAIGSRTIQATGLTPGATVFVRLSGVLPGSYRLTADAASVATSVTTFSEGQFGANQNSARHTLYIARPQIMHLALTATASTATAGIRMTIRDAAGNTVQSLETLAGQTVSGDGILFRPGAYNVQLEAIRPTGFTGSIGIAIRGNRTDDPVGAQPQDPTFEPTYINPNNPDIYTYPLEILALTPFYWLSDWLE